MKEKENIKELANVFKEDRRKDYRQWEKMQCIEIKSMSDDELYNAIKICEMCVEKSEVLRNDEGAGRLINNMILVATVYITGFMSVFIAILSVITPVKMELLGLIEEKEDIMKYQELLAMTSIELGNDILKYASYLLLIVAFGMIILEVYRMKTKKYNVLKIVYYKERLKMMKLEMEKRNNNIQKKEKHKGKNRKK